VCAFGALCVKPSDSQEKSSFKATFNHVKVKAAAANGADKHVHLNQLQKSQPAMISSHTQ